MMMKKSNSFSLGHFIFFIGIVSGLMTLHGCTDETEDSTLHAQAILTSIHADTDSTFLIGDQSYGWVDFFQSDDSVVTIEIYLENFPPNTIHSVHIHSGSCTQPGMHWNQGYDMTTYFCTETSLGLPWAKPRAGDVGNVSVGYDGSGIFTLQTDIWKLSSHDALDIIDLSIVIHEMQDDFVGECDPGHDHSHTHTNAKVACGSIELM